MGPRQWNRTARMTTMKMMKMGLAVVMMKMEMTMTMTMKTMKVIMGVVHVVQKWEDFHG